MDRYPRARDRGSDRAADLPEFGVVVEVEDGSWGLGVAVYGAPVAALITNYLAPRLIGENVMATEAIYEIASRLCLAFGPAGLASYAISAIDLAVWDCKAKLLGVPVYELLGGPVRDQLSLYATGADIDWFRELGFAGVKLPRPCGPEDGLDGIRRTVDLVAATREQVGDDIEIMLDSWMTFNVDYTIRLAEALRPYRLRWIEEALPSDDFDGHRELRLRVPWQSFATGEHWYGTKIFHYAAAHHLVDIFQPDITWVGGLTPLIKICAIAEAAGIEVMLHAGGVNPFGQHASLALPAITWTEYFVSTPPGINPPFGPYSFPEQGVPINGQLAVNPAPGFGLSVGLAELHDLG